MLLLTATVYEGYNDKMAYDGNQAVDPWLAALTSLLFSATIGAIAVVTKTDKLFTLSAASFTLGYLRGKEVFPVVEEHYESLMTSVTGPK